MGGMIRGMGMEAKVKVGMLLEDMEVDMEVTRGMGVGTRDGTKVVEVAMAEEVMARRRVTTRGDMIRDLVDMEATKLTHGGVYIPYPT